MWGTLQKYLMEMGLLFNIHVWGEGEDGRYLCHLLFEYRTDFLHFSINRVHEMCKKINSIVLNHAEYIDMSTLKERNESLPQINLSSEKNYTLIRTH